MIAQRFRSVGWVASIAVAATGLYMISLHVASERGRLETIDRKIASTKRDIRQLQTELGTRASLRQLERWNGDVLALSAPGASQYLNGEAALASADQSALGKSNAPPPAVMVAVGADAKADEAAKAAKAAPALLAMVMNPAPIAKPKILPTKPIEKSPAAKPQKVAMLDKKIITDLARKEANAKKVSPTK
jgi:hypothetical protein